MSTKIELEEPFKSKWKYGYLVTNKEPRRNVILFNKDKDKDRTTISYARYLMSVHLGRELSKDEHVDHINNDRTDDRLENLQILTLAENNAKEARRRGRLLVEYECPVCQLVFTRRTGNSNRIPSRKRSVICCTRRCGVKFSNWKLNDEQREEILVKQFIREFRLHE